MSARTNSDFISALPVLEAATVALNVQNGPQKSKSTLSVFGKLVAKSCLIRYDDHPYFFVKIQDSSSPVFLNIAFKAGSERLRTKLKLTGRYVFTNLSLKNDEKVDNGTVLWASKETICLSYRKAAIEPRTAHQWFAKTSLSTSNQDFKKPSPVNTHHSFTSCTQIVVKIIESPKTADGIFSVLAKGGQGSAELHVGAIPSFTSFSAILNQGNVVRLTNIHDCQKRNRVIIYRACLHTDIEVLKKSDSEFSWKKSAMCKLVQEFGLNPDEVETVADRARDFEQRLQLDRGWELVRALMMKTGTFGQPKRTILDQFVSNICPRNDNLLQPHPMTSVEELRNSLMKNCRQNGSVILDQNWTWKILDLHGDQICVIGRLDSKNGRLCLVDTTSNIPCVITAGSRNDSVDPEDIGAIICLENYQFVLEMSENGTENGYVHFPWTRALKLLQFKRDMKGTNVQDIRVIHKESLLMSESKYLFCFKAIKVDSNDDDKKTLTVVFEDGAARYYDVIRTGRSYRISGSVVSTGLPLVLQNKMASMDHLVRYSDVTISKLDSNLEFHENLTRISELSSSNHRCGINVEGIVIVRRFTEPFILSVTLRDVITPDVIECRMVLTNQVTPYGVLPGAKILFRNVTVQRHRDLISVVCSCASSFEILFCPPSDSFERVELTRVDHWCAPEAHFWDFWSRGMNFTVRGRLCVRVVLRMSMFVRCASCGGKVRRRNCSCGKVHGSLVAQSTLMVDDKTCLGIVNCNENSVRKLLDLDHESWKELEDELTTSSDDVTIEKDTPLASLSGVSSLIGQLCRGAILCRDWEMVLKPLGRLRPMTSLSVGDLPMRTVRRGDVRVKQRQLPYLRFDCVDVRYH